MAKSEKKAEKSEVIDLTNALKIERADAVNLRRRHQEEMASLRQRVKSDVVSDLLPIIDNFERALKHVPKDLEKNEYIKGVNAIVSQFENTLKQMGVKTIIDLEDRDASAEIPPGFFFGSGTGGGMA